MPYCVSTFTISLNIRYKLRVKNPLIYYPFVYLIAHRSFKFKDFISMIIKYLSYLRFQSYVSNDLIKYFYHVDDEDRYRERRKRDYWLNHHLSCFSRLWAAQRSRARVQNIVFNWPLDETTIYQSTSSRFDETRTYAAE